MMHAGADGLVPSGPMPPSFELFGVPHLSAVILTFAVGAAAIWGGARASASVDLTIRGVLAAGLWGLELARQIDLVWAGEWAIATSLPINICPACALILPVLLFVRAPRVYEVVFFWALVGTMQAVLTPDLAEGFPSFRFFRFMATHGLIVVAAGYIGVVDQLRPRWSSVVRTLWVTNLYALAVAATNVLVGGNYLFLCHKPLRRTVIDFLGPWPVYIVGIEVLGLLLVVLYYLPFAAADAWRGSAAREQGEDRT